MRSAETFARAGEMLGPDGRTDRPLAARVVELEVDVHRPPAALQDRLEDAVVAGRVGDGTAKAVPAGSRRRSGRVIRETHVRNIKS